MSRVAVIPVLLAGVVLAGCTSGFLGSEAQTAPEPTVTVSSGPTAQPDPTPTATFACDDILLDRPGNYVLGDCGAVTLEGGGIDLVAASIVDLVIRGDGSEVRVGRVDSLDLDGQRHDVSAGAIGDIAIAGDDNVVTVDEGIGLVVVNGNGNTVLATEGIGRIVDNGLLNEFE